MADQTRDYEGLFLFGTAATANAEQAQNTVKGFIEKHGGNIQVLKNMGDRKLAYEVAKQARGLYIYSFFGAAPGAIAAIEREVRLSDDVLRCLITDGSHLTLAEAQAMELQKPEVRTEAAGDDRGLRRRPSDEDEDLSDDSDEDEE